MDMTRKRIIFWDTEISLNNRRICDIGAVRSDDVVFHSSDTFEFDRFVKWAEYSCGHNILAHDLPILEGKVQFDCPQIDTLYLSPLLFPKKPYHRLVKDEKIFSDELNNPVSDSKKCQILFEELCTAFLDLPANLKLIYFGLLGTDFRFKAFFQYLGFNGIIENLERQILIVFKGEICENASLSSYIKHQPVELAYVLALISTGDRFSILPRWVSIQFPGTENILTKLRFTSCTQGCCYCQDKLNPLNSLKRYFGYDKFRTYDGEPLQQEATQAAVNGESLLAIFPTGGGKSLTFQLPALMAGERARGLTVVISPLQSLMKDQVDHLVEAGIVEAVTINGMLNSLERSQSYEQVYNGQAKILYISPESLRSKTLERALLSRHIVRFVVDEAHCFSAWGHDFRVDYLYIGDFIRKFQEKKHLDYPIPVSCFTATAKPKVIQDIQDYFREKLNIRFSLFVSKAIRKNLKYSVWYKEDDEKKYQKLRDLIASHACPTIVYTSRVAKTIEISSRLIQDGFLARPYNGQMDSEEKKVNQDAFLTDNVPIIVATNAFGMGVDKKDVGLVVHYDISSSLENYVQEAGRAGRDPNLEAQCHILFNVDDLEKHFSLLSRDKLSLAEIQQVWQVIKNKTRFKEKFCTSAYDLALESGWRRDQGIDVETKVKTAIAALELAGYISREQNVPHVYGNSLKVSSLNQAKKLIEESELFLSEEQRIDTQRVIQSLISSYYSADRTETRVDYMADHLAISKQRVICAVTLLREMNIINDDLDMSAYIFKGDSENKSKQTLKSFIELEFFLIKKLGTFEEIIVSLKELNGQAIDLGISSSSVKKIRSILFFLKSKGYFDKIGNYGVDHIHIVANSKTPKWKAFFEYRKSICQHILEQLYLKALEQNESSDDKKRIVVRFSVVSLKESFSLSLGLLEQPVSQNDIESALLYLSCIDAVRLEGGFLVLYNTMTIVRKELNNHRKYKQEDYQQLNEYYKQKIQQIHIVGKYANLMLESYEEAQKYIYDYFHLDYSDFINLYFKNERKAICRNITKARYEKLFGSLSVKQKEIIDDKTSQHIVVAAGPGSGKTRVLVHKLASLILLEDVKSEQLLMLTFSRASATEFKKRLIDLVKSAAFYVDVKTFHSYCFDLLGRVGSIENADHVVETATAMIQNGDVEQEKITKSVLVIDEAQDMSETEFNLVTTLMSRNETMRVIAVGDDDQNIYEFRESNSKYFASLITKFEATFYEMTENYRSSQAVVNFANQYSLEIKNRMKSKQAIAVRREKGLVQWSQYRYPDFEEGVVDHFVNHRQKDSRSAILTETNEEAFIFFNLLNQGHIPVRLIQSRGDICLSNLLEFGSFLNCLKNRIGRAPIINKDIWYEAKAICQQRFSNSLNLELLLNLTKAFESINQRKMYLSDWEEYVRESELQDCYEDKFKGVFISTIHKAKGQEFEDVYLILKNQKPRVDAEKRKVYVGMTRAKNRLFIHSCERPYINESKTILDYQVNNQSYESPSEILLSMTLEDVFLGFTVDKKNLICSLRAGESLLYKDGFFYVRRTNKQLRVARISKKFALELEKLSHKGYQPFKAEVGYVVAWRDKENGQTLVELLPNLYLKK